MRGSVFVLGLMSNAEPGSFTAFLDLNFLLNGASILARDENLGHFQVFFIMHTNLRMHVACQIYSSILELLKANYGDLISYFSLLSFLVILLFASKISILSSHPLPPTAVMLNSYVQQMPLEKSLFKLIRLQVRSKKDILILQEVSSKAEDRSNNGNSLKMGL